MAESNYHRFGEELWQAQEIKYAPETRQRVALALGSAPLEDARHLLPPVPLVPPFPPLPVGPQPATDFVIDFVGFSPTAFAMVQSLFHPAQRSDLGFVHLWVQEERSPKRWVPLSFEQAQGRVTAIALSWELAALLTEGTDAIQELAGYVLRAGERASRLFCSAVPRVLPEEAGNRAGRLIAMKTRFSRTIEMRLLPMGRAFPARSVWRNAYSLGLRWGEMDLFYWHDPKTNLPLFLLNSVGHPGYFLPERAAEGEGTPGIALSFELARCPMPLETYDRMSIALAYLRQHLGGFPRTAEGAELDADRLYEDRDALASDIQEMSRLEIAPGSPAAIRFFL